MCIRDSISDIHIAANTSWRNDRMQTLLGRRETDSSHERLSWNLTASGEQGKSWMSGVVLPYMKGRLDELICKQSKARNIGRPTPTRWMKLIESDAKCVTRLSSLYINRSGNWINS